MLANAVVPSQWIGCHPGDLKDANGNYCGVTAESVQQLTDEHLSVSEGIKRLMLAHASGKPWWVSIGNHRPHTTFRVPQGKRTRRSDLLSGLQSSAEGANNRICGQGSTGLSCTRTGLAMSSSPPCTRRPRSAPPS